MKINSQPKFAKMTPWFSPFQLCKTAGQVAISEIIGTRADYRVLESLLESQPVFDYSINESIWVDYVADLGDGWNSTYSVASLLAQPTLKLTAPSTSDEEFDTERGRILIMGGDQVYPTASRDNYQQKLVWPYQCALGSEPNPPHLFAIPGNHDWYDGLVSFTRLFCQGKPIGGWLTQQKRSYFAIKLPHHWWLLGVDIQLDEDIDLPQLEYFKTITSEMQLGDYIILCTPTPNWIYGNIYDKKLENTLAQLQDIIQSKGAKVMVNISGDLHHYRHHESMNLFKTHLITAGGGGAFLHPTNGPDVNQIHVGHEKHSTAYELKAEFPSRKKSSVMAFKNLLFPFINPAFGVLTGIAYIFIASILHQFPLAQSNISTILKVSTRALLFDPMGLVVIFSVLLGFIFFTDTHSKIYKWLGGLIHGLSHMFSAIIIVWIVSTYVIKYLELRPYSHMQLIISDVGIFLGGYLAGSFIMGIYLLISINIFQRHTDEAYSSLAIEDYKNFLRLHIDSKGLLTIYPVGITTVAKKWTLATVYNPGQPKFVPDKKQKIEYSSIENPIQITR